MTSVSGSTVPIAFSLQLPGNSSLKASGPITFSSPVYIPAPNAGSTTVYGPPNGDYPLSFSDAATIVKTLTDPTGNAGSIMKLIALNPELGGPIGAVTYGALSFAVQGVFWLQEQSTFLIPQGQ